MPSPLRVCVPQLQQFVYSPLEEHAALRLSPALLPTGSKAGLMIPGGGGSIHLGDWGAKGVQAEILVAFRVPSQPGTFGVSILGGALEAYVDFLPKPEGAQQAWEVRVGIHGQNQELALLPSDQEIELRIFVDHTISEVYFQNGRVALTTPLSADVEGGSSTAFAAFNRGETGEVELASAAAWALDTIWVQPQQVINGA
jgi:hypothetical protein